MASVLKETLYAASGRAVSNSFAAGTEKTGASQTEAQTHDASDATYDRFGGYLDGDWILQATGVLTWTGGTPSYSGAIDKVVVRARAKYASTATGSKSADLQAYFGAAARGTASALTTSAADYAFEFTTDPRTGLAWTPSGLSTMLATLGIESDYAADGTSPAQYLDVTLYEFAVDVYGPDKQTSSPASVAAVAAVCAASVLIGSVASSCDSVNMTAATSPTTAVPGSRTVIGESCGMVAEVSPSPLEVFALAAARSPLTVTPLAAREAGGSVISTLRCRDASLRDGRWDTYEGDSQIGPYTGDLTVGTLGIGLDSVAGSGEIAGVVVHALVRLQSEPPLPTVTNTRVSFGGGDYVLSPSPPSGDYGAGQVNYADLATALITTTDGGTTPWTWDNLYTALLMLSLSAHVVYAGIGTPTELDVCELWVEVRGPVGSHPSRLRGRDWMRNLRGRDTLTSDLGG